ncbi:ABC transporter permease [Olivibacter sp. SDN3]|uniref:ABC transporter permease n=1 Tax=Olivibacter sp. SDN3 TaxID=2764720 RepID=UPI001651795F|nr:ABC transporter permease [Olivibacter sp. SDN3]QNL50967.1 ABC transporter permease [Olivibacter sp. SDN3]
MLRNYLKIAVRNLAKAKGFAFINIAGLAIGMAAAVLIILWIKDELTYDRFYAKTDRIYEVYNRGDFNEDTHLWPNAANPLAPLLKKDYPEFETVVRYTGASLLLSVNENYLKSDGLYADSDFFHVFDFPTLQGNVKETFGSNDGIVLTESLAKKLYGSIDIIGKNVQVDSTKSLTIIAVLEDLPENTRFKHTEYFLSWDYFEAGMDKETAESWINIKVPTLALLKSNTKVENVNEKIKHILEDVQGIKSELFLHPATKWHLYSKQEHGAFTGGRIDTVRLFSVIAFFILLIACINFMNLSTARSANRAKEVGVRKVMGAQKKMLMGQFLSESIILALLAGFTAILLVFISLPTFNTLLGKKLFVNVADPHFWLCSLGFILFTGVLAGSYPAFFLSSFKPVNVLKGVFKLPTARFSARKILVVFQFVFAIILIISTFIIEDQINHAQNRQNGYNKEHLISIPMNNNLREHYEAFHQELIYGGAATSVTRSSGTLTNHTFGSTNFSWPGSSSDDLDKAFVALTADGDFKNTMGIKILEGRDIDIRQYKTDSSAMLLNEAAVKTMGLQNPIGTIIKNGDQQWQVVGVVNDFIFYSPYQSINPLFILGSGDWFNFIYIRLNPNHSTPENLMLAEDVFKKYNANEPFTYHFTDELYAKSFENEERTSKLTGLFSSLTIFISCLGLFGLAAYTATQRRKEIGVRKVLGAKVNSIVHLLSKDFIKLVLIAFIIASPIAYYVMDTWLQDFNYRISITWYTFFSTGVLAIMIALLTVSFQALKAALANPVNSLRDE